jgi:SAM-dependent methyltransferase
MPSASDLRRFYEADYRSSYKGARTPKPKHIYRSGRLGMERLRRLADRLVEPSRVLDLGSGGGEWLYLLKARGHSVAGIELDPAYAAFGRQEYGVEVLTGSVMTIDLPEGEFDCVTTFHVLEHLPDPIAALSRMRTWLRDSGVLAVEVPNMNSPHQHPAKRFHYAHVVGFTPESLTFAAGRGGFECVELSLDRHERNIFAVLRKLPSAGQSAAPGRAVGAGAVPSPLLTSASATVAYYLRPSTYWRWGERVRQFASEYWAVRAGLTPREILQSVARDSS